MAEVERALEWAVDGEDVIVRPQTPRLVSLMEDRVPSLELYRALEAELRIKTTVMQQLLDDVSSWPSNVREHTFAPQYSESVAAEPKSSRVFVVHGRNAGARDAMFEFLRAIGLRPIEWAQAVQATGKGSPYIGEILDAAFEQAQAVVVLMTPDEIAYLRTEYGHGANDPETQPAAQARPNVLFEAGMAMGRDSDRAILVELGDVRPFSDVAGRHAVRLDDSPGRRKELAQRLATAGCAVDLSGEDWLRAGDFTPPAAPGGGLPLGKRVPAGTAPTRVRLDLRHHDRSNGGRLEIINLGTEPVFDVNLEFPPEAGNFHVLSDELPLARLPAGKSAKLVTSKSWGGGRDHFDVRVTATTADGDPVVEDIFLSLVD
jgi:predicted nucleotide-binding protein